MNDLKAPEKKFRPELEGVRVLAAFLVAVYHIWLGKVSGGVDVFFIVSGYLITTSLLNRVIREGFINFFNYILGLMRRLLPMALSVILVTALLSIIILPQSIWEETLSQIFSSMLYFQNWELAFNSVDYLAQNNAASPYQHFWALSLQGQFYVIWPIVILIAFMLATKVFKKPMRKTLLFILFVLFTSSLIYSIYITNVNQPWAYFDTFARVWEFSLGGILALLLPYCRINQSISFIIGWLGFLIISFTGILLPVSDVFPGYAALLPILGVILIIIAAENASNFGVEKLLGSKALLFLGSLSYGFYLWHWPILILYLSYFGTDTVSLGHGLLIMMLSFILSYFSAQILEKPIRKISVVKNKRKLITVLILFILPVILTGVTWNSHIAKLQTTDVDIKTENNEKYPGAKVFYENVIPQENVDILPSPIQAKKDRPEFYKSGSCYTKMDDYGINKCTMTNSENPEHTIALVGGSHAGHWFPALNSISDELNFEITVYNKDGCRFSADDFNGGLSDSCMDWNEKVIGELIEDEPDLIFTNANVSDGDSVPKGYIEQWKKLENEIDIVAIRDNPWMEESIPECIEEKNEESCSVPRDEVLSDKVPWENNSNLPNNVSFLDFSDFFCDDGTCPPVIGNVLVYRDRHHITTVYSESLAKPLKEELEKILN